MKIVGLESVIEDNSIHYIFFVIGGLIHADPKGDIEMHKANNIIHFIIRPSHEEFKKAIIKNMLDIHKLMQIKADFCKSTEKTKNVYFSVSFGELN